MPGREGKSGIVLASHGKRGLKETKKITNEASMLLKTKEGTSKTMLKQTQNGVRLSAEMHESRIRLELPDTSMFWQGPRTEKTSGVEPAQEAESRGLREFTKIVGMIIMLAPANK